MQSANEYGPPVARKSRRLTAQEREVRRRIADYGYREWLRFQKNEPEATQDDFARKLDLDPGTISRIVNRKGDGAGLNVAIALIFRGGLDAQHLFRVDPVLPREGEVQATDEPATQRPAARR
jgi:hypothetical protein